MNRDQTKARLIELNIDPTRLSEGGMWDLRGADLCWADLGEIILNWNSHDLLAEIALRAAGDDLRKRMTAGLILISRDWCWEKLVIVLDEGEKQWLGFVFAPYVKDGDNAPDIVRQYMPTPGDQEAPDRAG